MRPTMVDGQYEDNFSPYKRFRIGLDIRDNQYRVQVREEKTNRIIHYMDWTDILQGFGI